MKISLANINCSLKNNTNFLRFCVSSFKYEYNGYLYYK